MDKKKFWHQLTEEEVQAFINKGRTYREMDKIYKIEPLRIIGDCMSCLYQKGLTDQSILNLNSKCFIYFGVKDISLVITSRYRFYP